MGTHGYDEDPRNDNVLLSINGDFFPGSKLRVRFSMLGSY